MNSNDDSVTIAVMGATGSGKSTFINLVSGSKLQVGDGLESCTSDVQVAKPFALDGKIVTLIDTPGFDDTVKTEAEILRYIADFLATTYESGRKLNGVIFLHRISDYRMGGVARKNFRLFKKLCGDDSLKHVVIVTNMWGDVKPDVGERREKELAQNDLFFKPALDKGAILVRHDNTIDSAHRIIREIMGFPPEPLSIQREIVDQNKTIAETSAGLDIQAQLDDQIRKHRDELQGLKEEVDEMLAKKDKKHQEELEELNAALSEVRGQLEKYEVERQQLHDEHEEERRDHEERTKKLMEMMRQREDDLRELQKRAEEQSKKIEVLTESLTSVQQQVSSYDEEKKKAEAKLKAAVESHKEEIANMRKEFEEKLAASKQDEPRVVPAPPARPSFPVWLSEQYRAPPQARPSFARIVSMAMDHFFNVQYRP